MRRGIAAATLALAALALLPAGAGASFHLMKISEVFPGTPAAFDKAFIELRMVASGQNQVTGHSVTVYNAAGTVTATVPMTGPVPNGQNNRTVLLGDIDVTNADFPANIGTLVPPAGGAVCFADAVPADCVSWGNFAAPGSLPATVGNNVAPLGIPAMGTTASALVRNTTPGCATFLEPGDDTDDSLADFSVVDAETPESNNDPVSTVACGGGGGDAEPPQTTITKQPKAKSSKRKAKVKFESNESGSSFMCKLDKKPFKACSSPFKKKVGVGKHKFKVYAVDGAGNKDATPAKAFFRRVRG
jgi:hypothetical protein